MTLREELANLEHEQWISWTKYLVMEWGNKLPQALIERLQKNWKAYSALSEDEKDKDRIWADKILDIMVKHIKQ